MLADEPTDGKYTMAGSFTHIPYLPYHEDPLLAARIEGLTLLAHQVNEPVVIVDSDLRLIYANPSAERLAGTCPLVEPGASAPAPPAGPSSCPACPAKELAENPRDPSASPAAPIDERCPLPRAVPIVGQTGVGCVVMMGPTGQPSVIWNAQAGDEQSRNDRAIASDLPELVGESPPMRQLIEMIRLVAASEATVLIQGESGTGKELVAKTIHRQSRRRARPFVVVECSSLPETLLESELFGHVRGAFTGATSDRKGLFEEAEGGTIFLDEIADTTPVFQAKLLRVLQEGEIKPVGSNRSIKVDVRVISASNCPLEGLMKAKAFRLDLYYRLAVLPLTIPPLRERREDIPLLVRYFLKQSCRKHGRDVPTVDDHAMEALMAHHWPGNVRELENLVERVVVTSQRTPLTAHDFFGCLPNRSESNPVSLREIGRTARREVEKTRILDALRQTGGDKTQAAKLLGISRASLYNKLKAYSIK
ncbi:MAG: AAA family ATPase [Nitrospirae bacterium]|nr:MAG: AAA family ATPase [Nitrospirota bacterium]